MFKSHTARAYPQRAKHATSINDLEKARIPLAAKLNFIKENGIAELTSIIDSKLRNDIAHLNFRITESDILIRGKPASEIVLPSLQKLNSALRKAHILIIRMATAKWAKPQLAEGT